MESPQGELEYNRWRLFSLLKDGLFWVCCCQMVERLTYVVVVPILHHAVVLNGLPHSAISGDTETPIGTGFSRRGSEPRLASHLVFFEVLLSVRWERGSHAEWGTRSTTA